MLPEEDYESSFPGNGTIQKNHHTEGVESGRRPLLAKLSGDLLGVKITDICRMICEKKQPWEGRGTLLPKPSGVFFNL